MKRWVIVSLALVVLMAVVHRVRSVPPAPKVKYHPAKWGYDPPRVIR